MSRAALAKEVAVRVYRLHGLLGYYRGYAASLAAYVPNSALWWALYTAYQGKIIGISNNCFFYHNFLINMFNSKIVKNIKFFGISEEKKLILISLIFNDFGLVF